MWAGSGWFGPLPAKGEVGTLYHLGYAGPATNELIHLFEDLQWLSMVLGRPDASKIPHGVMETDFGTL